MTLASPWLLLGLLLVGLPILIHLWQQRRIQAATFPELTLLKRAKRKASKRLRARDALLLALRVGAVALIALALARPYLLQEAGPEVPQAVAVVLDASFSMGHGDAFSRAKDAADDLLASLGPQDTAALFVAAPGLERKERPALSYEVSEVRAQLAEAQRSEGADSLDEAIRSAAQSLNGAAQPLRRVVVFTDGTRRAFQGQEPSPPWPAGGPRLEIVDVAAPSLPNRAVLSVQVAPAEEAGPRSFRVSARLANYGPSPVEELPITVEVAGQVAARGFVTLGAGEIVTKTFHMTPSSGGQLAGRVVLPADELPADDTRAFVLAAPRELRALLVNGDPRALRFDDELFFLEQALASAPASSRPRITTVTADGLPTQDLSAFDVVALCNVGALSGETVRSLRSFVEAGGGLFVSGGQNVASSLHALDKLLPVKLRDVFVASDGAFSGGGTPRRLAPAERGHPVFQDFDPSAPGGLSLARFGTILLFEPSAKDQKKTLLSFDDGAPALIESPLGQGRLVVFASTIDREWTDLPTRPGYVPLMQGLFRYLGGSAEGPGEAESLVGEARAVALPLGSKPGRATVTPPEGSGEEAREILPSAFEGLRVKLPGLNAPGVWKLALQGSSEPARLFAVGLDPAESNLQKLSAESLAAATARSGSGLIGSEDSSGDTPAGRSLAPYALLFLLLVLVGEAVFLWRRGPTVQAASPAPKPAGKPLPSPR